MSILIFSIILIVLSLLLLAAAAKALFSAGWFLKWLRGSGGLIMLLMTLFGGLLAVELFSYFKADPGEVVATLTFGKRNHQEFDVELVNSAGDRSIHKIYGDQWQLDVRLIALGEFGLPSYKLDRLSGRYLSLEQEKNEQRSIYGLSDSNVFDIWLFVEKQQWIPLLKAQYGTAAFMPMVDGAIYQVKLFEKGLMAEPVNDQARVATEQW